MGLHQGQTNSGSFKKGERKSHKTEFKKGISASPKTQFKKGQTPWNKGKKGAQKAWNKGIPLSEEAKEKIRKKLRKPDRKLMNVVRDCQMMRNWVKKLLERDDYTCQACEKRGGRLCVHHKEPFVKIMRNNNIKTLEEAFKFVPLWDKSNAMTLCWSCHHSLHLKEHGGFSNAGR